MGQIQIRSVTELAADQTSSAGLLAGPGLVKFASHFCSPWQRAPESAWQPQAATVALLAHNAALSQRFADPYSLEPLYLRRSYAEEKRSPNAPQQL